MDDQTVNPPVNPLSDPTDDASKKATVDPTSQTPGASGPPQASEPALDLTSKTEEPAETGDEDSQVTTPPPPMPANTQPAQPPSSGDSDMAAKPVAPPAAAPGTDENLQPLDDKTDEPTEPSKPPMPAEPSQPAGVTPSEPSAEEPTEEPSFPPVSDSIKPEEAAQEGAMSTEPTPVAEPSGTPAVPAQPGSETPREQAATDDLKKTHEPIIVMPDDYEMGQTVNVKVKVGMVPHVMEEEHYIQSIELLANDKSIGKKELNPKENPTPEADFQVALSAGMKLKAIEHCNVHGKWEAERSV